MHECLVVLQTTATLAGLSRSCIARGKRTHDLLRSSQAHGTVTNISTNSNFTSGPSSAVLIMFAKAAACTADNVE